MQKPTISAWPPKAAAWPPKRTGTPDSPPTVLTPRFQMAFLYAMRLHENQRRKTGFQAPYLAHLMGVASLVLEYGGSEDMAIAALLHDAAEDQGGEDTLNYIYDVFGSEVGTMVQDCTDAMPAEGEAKAPWKERKLAYLQALPEKSEWSLLVSMADKVYNARAIVAEQRLQGDRAFEKFKGGKDGTVWYYRSLVAMYQQALDDTEHPLQYHLDGIKGLMSELRVAVNEMERLAYYPNG